MFLLARQHLSNRSSLNDLVDVVATYNCLDSVDAHLQACFCSFSDSLNQPVTLWYMVGMTIYVSVHTCAVSMATPMQIG